MKILAIENEIEGVAWDNAEDLLKDEAQHVYNFRRCRSAPQLQHPSPPSLRLMTNDE